jgi:F-type H+-transporting ATPase subunit b
MFTAQAYAQTNEETAPDAEGELEETIQEAIEIPASPPAESPFPPFDSSTFPSQLLWLAITFGLFYLFLQRIVLPRISGILEGSGTKLGVTIASDHERFGDRTGMSAQWQ